MALESGPAATVTVVRHEQVAGRDTAVVELRRTDTPAVSRFWADQNRMFVMKSLFDTGGGQLVETVEITHLRYGETQDASRFSWVAPGGAVQNTCSPAMAEMMAGRFPAPFLAIPGPSEYPGLAIATSGTATAKDGTCSEAHTELRARPFDDTPNAPFIQVGQNRERPDSVITGSRDDLRPLAAGTVDAYLWHEDDVLLLAWVHNGLGVQLKSNALTEDELVAFGEAMLAPKP
jgi:hypothetical protein